jgi:iron complex outermembrane receptor protein
MHLKSPAARSKLALAILAALPAGSSFAADAAPVATVVVSGSREPQPLRHTAQSIDVIGREQLDGTVYVGDALNTVPGVYVPALSGNEQHNMSIRESLSSNALYQYLEDSIPIRPVGVYNYNALVELNAEAAGQVEVVKGPSSSLFGNNAVGGAINFVTRAPAAAFEGKLGVELGDQGFRRINVGASDTFGANGVRFSGYQAQRRDGWERSSDFDKHAYSLRDDYRIDAANLVKTYATSSRFYSQVPGSLAPADYLSRPDYSYNNFTYRRFDTDRLTSSLLHTWAGGAVTTATVYLRHASSDDLTQGKIKTVTPTTATGRLISDDFDSYGLDLRHAQQLAASVRLIAGAGIEHTPYRAHETNLDIVRDAATSQYLRYTAGSTRRDYDVGLRNASAYAQFEWTPLRDLRLTAGGRIDRIGYDYANHLAPSANTGPASQQQHYSHASPKAGAIYRLAETTDLYANYSQGYTPPDISQLYGQLVAPNLKPASFDSFELGSRSDFLQGRAHVEAALYRMNGRQEMIVYNQVAGGIGDPRNADTRHQGLELGATYMLSRQFDTRVGATVAQHVYRGYGFGGIDYSGKDMRAAPKKIFNAEIGFTPTASPRTRFSVEFQHLGGYWMNDANTVRYPGHNLLNLKAQASVGRWELAASVRNAADRRYAEVATSSYTGAGAYTPATMDSYSPGAPRSIFISATHAFGEHQL